MPVKLYMDVHVPAAITSGLRERGVDVITAQEDQRRRASDDALLDRATELGRLIYTQDEDFLAEAAQRQRNGIPFGGVIYVHQSRLTIGERVRELETIATLGTLEEFSGRVQFLPLRPY